MAVWWPSAPRISPSFRWGCKTPRGPTRLPGRGCRGRPRGLAVDRLRLADTVGIWNPFQVQATIARAAASRAGLAAGISRPQRPGHGHGQHPGGPDGRRRQRRCHRQRPGRAGRQRPAGGSGHGHEMSLGRPCGIDARAPLGLAALVAEASGRTLPDGKPITGPACFATSRASTCRRCWRLAKLRTVSSRNGWTVGSAIAAWGSIPAGRRCGMPCDHGDRHG